MKYFKHLNFQTLLLRFGIIAGMINFVSPAELSAQFQDSSFYLCKAGEILYFEHSLGLKYTSILGGEPYLVDKSGGEYKMNEIDCYFDGFLHYQKFPHYKTSKDTWFELRQNGVVNIYSITSHFYTMYSSVRPAEVRTDFFQTGDKPPQPLKYKYVLPLVSTNPLALKELQKGRRSSYIRYAVSAIGTGLFAYGGYRWYKNQQNEVSGILGEFPPVMLLGAITMYSVGFIPNMQFGCKRAIDVYNGRKPRKIF